MRKCVVFITGFFYMVLLVVRSSHGKRTSSKPTRRDVGEEMFSEETQKYFLELETNAQLKYGARKLPPSKPYCSGNCETNKKDRSKENQTSSSRAKYDSASYEDESRSSTDEDKVTKNQKVRFSKQYNPSTVSADSDFVPISSPFKNQSSKNKSIINPEHRRAKLRSVEELSVKESRQDPNMLGNGHFEILTGGIFSDHETNEIPGGGRRVGRTFDTFMVPQFRRPSYNVVHYPNVYQGAHVATHPMFFPRAAYSERSEIRIKQ